MRRAQVAMTHPLAVTNCNIDMESLISDANRSIATLAITTLLKTGSESSVERLLKQIGSFMTDIADEFKIVVVEAIRALCLKFPQARRPSLPHECSYRPASRMSVLMLRLCQASGLVCPPLAVASPVTRDAPPACGPARSSTVTPPRDARSTRLARLNPNPVLHQAAQRARPRRSTAR